MKKRIHLAFDFSWTLVETWWRQAGSWVDIHHPNIGMFEEVARNAERGGMDFIFFGDSTGIPSTWKNSIEDGVRYGVAWPRFEIVVDHSHVPRDESRWIWPHLCVNIHASFLHSTAAQFARSHN